MSVLVEQQDETINVIETQAAGVEKDTEVGLVHRHSVATLSDFCLALACNTPIKPWYLLEPRARSDGSVSSLSSSSLSLSLLLLRLSSSTTTKISLVSSCLCSHAVKY